MFLMVAGIFDIGVLIEVSGFHGQVFYILFVFVVLLLLLNVFATIVNEMFSAIRTLDAVHARKLYLLGFLKLVRHILD
jgi:hypothetical protein